MVRKSCYIGFSYFAGFFLCTIGWGRNNIVFALASACVAITVFALFKRYRKHIALCFVSFLIAVGVNTAYTHIFYDKLTALDGKAVTVKGEITDISYIGSDTCRLSVNGTVGGVKGRLTFYADDIEYDYYDNIVATVKVSRIKDSINFKSEQ